MVPEEDSVLLDWDETLARVTNVEGIVLDETTNEVSLEVTISRLAEGHVGSRS